MPRTTLNIDATVLRELKRRQSREGKALGELASELLAGALAEEERVETPGPLLWTARSMAARIDIEDKDALRAALDAP